MNHPSFITSEKTWEILSSSPEDGMGWQFGEVFQRGGKQPTIIVGTLLALNPSLPQKVGIRADAKSTDIIFPSPQDLGFEATKFSNQVIETIEEELVAGGITGINATHGTAPATFTGTISPIWEKTLTKPQVFYRFCAIDLDPRIDSDGSVKPNTYATTESERPHVPSGLAAVGRFALPIRTSARHVRKITAPIGTVIRYGTVEPNFGLAGGGVEALFPNGLPPGSAESKTTEIPEM